MTSSFLPSGVRDSRMQTVNTRSTQHSMATRFKLRRIDVGNLKRKLKQLFTLNFKAFKSCSRSGATLTPMMIDEEDNKENRPTEHKLPFQLRIFELCSPGPETEDDDCGLPMEVFERLCELEEEMIWLRTRVQHRGEEFRFIDAESLKHIMKTTITEYEAQFWKTVKESVKSQIRCTFLEDELLKTRESLFHYERKLETEKRNQLQLKHLIEYVKASLAQELQKQTWLMCKENAGTVLFRVCIFFTALSLFMAIREVTGGARPAKLLSAYC